MDPRPFTILSLCSGVGGLDLGLRVAQPNARTICFVEIEAFACAILAARMAENALDPAPIWTNLKTFDGKPWRGVVDCITAGYPCQPFSVAGKQRGSEDPRHLWPDVFRVVREINPPFCFFENVGGHLRLGFEQVHDDLRSVGYRVKAGLFTAQEVGAPHKRERLFILAYAEGTGERRETGNIPETHGRPDRSLFQFVGSASDVMADSSCLVSERAGTKRDSSGQSQESIGSVRDVLADTDGAGFQETRPELQPAWAGREYGQLGNAQHDGSYAATLVGSDGEYAGARGTAGGQIPPQQSARTDCLANTAGTENIIREPRSWKVRQQAGQVSTPPLAMAAIMWPTVTTQDAKNNAGPSQFERNTKPLNVEATLHSSRQGQKETGTGSQKVLNPRFVEWLMGWPIGWTEFVRAEMVSCRWLPHMRGALSYLMHAQQQMENTQNDEYA